MVRKALGKGLDTILPVSGEQKETATIPQHQSQEVPITLIDPNPDQPRTSMNEKSLKELSNSIQEQGVIQPLIVKRVNERYQLIAGERRLRACEIAGFTKVPVVIKDIDDEDLLVLALIENIQREDLNPLEESQAYEALVKQKGMTQEEVAVAVGKDRSTIANSLRLLKLPRYILEALSSAQLSSGHARALLMLETNPEGMKELFSNIITKGLSVRESEDFVKRLKNAENKEPVKSEKKETDPYLADAEKRLCNKLSAKVQIKQKESGGGQININFASNEDLQRLFDILVSIKY